jgi:hypothetical protein
MHAPAVSSWLKKGEHRGMSSSEPTMPLHFFGDEAGRSVRPPNPFNSRRLATERGGGVPLSPIHAEFTQLAFNCRC